MRRGVTIALTLTALAAWWPAQAGAEPLAAAATPAGATTRWAIQPTPAPPGSEFYDVFCRSATDCTAVGNYQDGTLDYVVLAEHWNGHTWAIEAAPTRQATTKTCSSQSPAPPRQTASRSGNT